MSNQQKLVLVLLVLLGLLYVLGLGAGFFFNTDRGKPSPASESGPPPLMETMDEWLAPFGPKLQLNGVQCNSQPVTRPFLLTQAAAECVLTFPPAVSGEKSRKATLRVLDGVGVPVQFAYKKPEQKPGASPDPCPSAEPNGLQLIFTELGQTPSMDCWSRKPAGKPIRVIALEKAATLRLVCKACQAGLVQRVSLEFE